MNKDSSLSFTKKYLFALVLTALFSTLAYFNLKTLTNSQENDAEAINISGRQRMLSQKIAFYAMTNKVEELKVLITLMENSHKLLVEKDMTDEFKKIYFSKPIELENRVKEYLRHAKIYIQNQNKDSLNYILNHAEDLLEELDYATSIYQDESDMKVQALQNKEFLILLLTLITLILEAVFIFNPANKSIEKKTKELLNQKDYLNLITNINTNAIIAVDQNFDILTFNKSAEKMFGYTEDEMLHTKLLDDRIIPLKYLKGHNAGIASFMNSGKLKNKNVVFELEGQHRDKTIFPLRISLGIKIEDNNKIVVANIQDITKEKEKDSLILQQSRFAAMGEMIGNIAHQWRQPLSSISTIATGAKLRYKNGLISDEELDETFVKIKHHTQYLSDTIDDFRNFFKEDKTKDVFSISDVVEKSITLIEASYKDNGITLVLQKPEKNLTLIGSSSELSQVILNILNNSKDVLIEKNVKNKKVLLKIEDENEDILVKVLDNAGGIPTEIIEKVFDPYFTTKHKSQGTGIGLFMSKKIITQHFNGTILVKNTEFSIDNEKFFGAEFQFKIKHSVV